MNDYDFEPKTGKSTFLKLKEKGDSIVIRLITPPYREPIIWKEGNNKPLDEEQTANLNEKQWFAFMRDPDYSINESYHWGVIDRSDGIARIFTGTTGIYKSIKEYAQMQQWGDPTRYDIEITRTEEPGRGYYKVTPYPDKSEPTDSEIEGVDNLNIADKKKNARLTSEPQLDDISEYLDHLKKKDKEGSEVGKGGSDVEPPVTGYEKAKSTARAIDKKAKASSELPPEEPNPYDDMDLDNPIDLSEIPF